MTKTKKNLCLVFIIILIALGLSPKYNVSLEQNTFVMAPSYLEESANSIESFAELDIPNMTMSGDGILSSIRLCSDSQESRTVSSSRSITIQATVPSQWTRGQSFQVKFDVYMSGYVYAVLDFEFEGFDNYPGPDEEREVHSKDTSIRVDASHDVHYLTCYNPSWVTVGLKRAQTHVSGLAYYKDGGVEPFSSEPVQPQIAPGYLSDYVSKNQVWDYEFVARYGMSDLETYGGLPPADAMSSTSGNPDYYWEGLDNDGFSISPSCSAYHPTMWPIIYQAGYLVDNSISYPEYSTETLIIMVHSLMTYQENADTLETTNSDMYTYNYNWIGVCDEFAVVLSSFLRAINIPCRYIYGKGTLLGDETAHAWCEAYVSGFWKHCDPTWNKFDQPWIYEYSFFWLEEIWIFSGADDSLHYDSNDLNDGGNYNGKLHYWFDFTYRVGYDGPNAY